MFEPIVVSDLCEGGLADKSVSSRRCETNRRSMCSCLSRTNAIHIGDRILAINDMSLRGKGLNEAIKLLQASTDEITLKISRTIHPQQSNLHKASLISAASTGCALFPAELPRSFHHPEEYTPSVDSAMESWDSSNTDHRLSDHSETAKEIVVTDHQQYPPYHNHSDSSATLQLPRSKSIDRSRSSAAVWSTSPR